MILSRTVKLGCKFCFIPKNFLIQISALPIFCVSLRMLKSSQHVVVNSICPTRRATPSTCLTFKLPSEVLREKVEVRVSSAELWVYKFEADLEFRDRVFTIDEISGNDSHNGSISTRLDPIQIVNNSVGWDAIKVSVTVGAWINRTIRFRIEKALTLQIGCRNCTNIYWYGSMSPIYNGNVPNRPFLVIKMAEAVQKNRRRRNINCQNGPSECCRESFRVSFSQIGWNWIIQPKEFDAFYCKGSCDSRSSRHHHTSAMQAYTREVASGNETVAKLLLPCCSPMKLEGITILYSLNNSNIQIQKNLPNMVVESCGCFGA